MLGLKLIDVSKRVPLSDPFLTDINLGVLIFETVYFMECTVVTLSVFQANVIFLDR